ncbi:MAG: hypothetical protein KDA85_11630, partial [Planctomycetaceae bacterium]|nr:hypothetical protein [Planctomycetaceae bacterium]
MRFSTLFPRVLIRRHIASFYFGLLFAVSILLTNQCVSMAGQDDDPVYSGPQVDEPLPGFEIIRSYGDAAGKPVDPVAAAGDRTLVTVFFHERTRPAFALTNLVTRMALSRRDKEPAVFPVIVFLTDDRTETENWLKQVQGLMPTEALIGVSPDGQEGPGALGLNRNVSLTVLVARQGKVLANFALVQPGVEVDGPKIFQAIVAASGGGEVPPLTQFQQGRRGEQMRQGQTAAGRT